MKNKKTKLTTLEKLDLMLQQKREAESAAGSGSSVNAEEIEDKDDVFRWLITSYLDPYNQSVRNVEYDGIGYSADVNVRYELVFARSITRAGQTVWRYAIPKNGGGVARNKEEYVLPHMMQQDVTSTIEGIFRTREEAEDALKEMSPVTRKSFAGTFRGRHVEDSSSAGGFRDDDGFTALH